MEGREGKGWQKSECAALSLVAHPLHRLPWSTSSWRKPTEKLAGGGDCPGKGIPGHEKQVSRNQGSSVRQPGAPAAEGPSGYSILDPSRSEYYFSVNIKLGTGYLDFFFPGKEGKGETCIIYLILKVKIYSPSAWQMPTLGEMSCTQTHISLSLSLHKLMLGLMSCGQRHFLFCLPYFCCTKGVFVSGPPT